MNTMYLPKEQFIKANNGFIHAHEFIMEYIYDDNEELYNSLCNIVKNNTQIKNDNYNSTDVYNSIRIKIYNNIISKNRRNLLWVQEHILDNWLDTFIDTKEVYNDIYNHLNDEK